MEKNHVILVLDESSSMNSIAVNVKQHVKDFVKEIQANAKKYKESTVFSVIKFSDKAQVLTWNQKLSDFTTIDYRPGGMTALYDAIGLALDKSEGDQYESFLLKIITDGQENQSRKYKPLDIVQRITGLQKTNWTIVFDVPDEISKNYLTSNGVCVENIRVWEQSKKGVEELTRASNEGVKKFYAAKARGQKSIQNYYQTDLSTLTSTDLKKLNDVQKKFRVLDVPKECVIKEFIEEKTSEPYLKGDAYYQLTKSEKVQWGKEILIMEKGKRSIWAGNEARQLLGLPEYQDVKVVPGNHANFDIFIQSTSVNRKLVRGTKLVVRK